MNTFEAHLQLKPESVPKFHKHRPVPFAISRPLKMSWTGSKRLESSRR